MKYVVIIFILLVIIVLFKIFGAQDAPDRIRIVEYIDTTRSDQWTDAISDFYRERDYKLAWFKNGQISQNGRELLDELAGSKHEGLPGELYGLSKLKQTISGLDTLKKEHLRRHLAQTDLLFSNAYFDYASDLSTGRVSPDDLDVIWEILPQKQDFAQHLGKPLRNGKIAETLEDLTPKNKQYELLKKAFNQLSAVKSDGGWPLPGSFSNLKKGDSGENVVKLKKYLHATGDLQKESPDDFKADFDQNLSEAIKNFQQRHGLKPDGIANEATLHEMNRPVDERISQLRLNLDRARWLPEDFGDKHIVVNIPAFSFEYYEKGELTQEMAVVVGKNENYTPVLKDTLYSVIFNPSWNIPKSIATKEMLPRLKKDRKYRKDLQKNGYVLLNGLYNSTDTVDAKKVKWDTITVENFPFSIVQEPGENNPLGKLEFMMLNQYSIYLHDTPAGHLFSEQQRDFSHGCIRLEKPVELAGYLLEGQLPQDSIHKFLSEEKKRRVVLEQKVPVHLVYHTAWVDLEGKIHFRNDIYGFDKLSLPFFADTTDKK